MFASTRSGSDAYRKVGVETGVAGAEPHALVLMLFDGALAAVATARMHCEPLQAAPKCAAIAKAIAIVDQGLKASLDPRQGGALAEGLASLYDYITRRLVEANLYSDARMLDEIARLLGELRTAWTQIKQPVAA